VKLDLLLEYQGTPTLIAWARETNLGVYMGVRFSSAVENLSCFQDGRREWLRFPMGPDGKRAREEVPIDPIPPIASIAYAQPILDRIVDVLRDGPFASPTPKSSPGTTEITIPQDHLGDGRWLSYEAHIVCSTRLPEFLTAKGDDPAAVPGGSAPLASHFPLQHFPEHHFVLTVGFNPPPSRTSPPPFTGKASPDYN